MESYFFVILVAQSHKMTFLHYNRQKLVSSGWTFLFWDDDRNDGVCECVRASNGFGFGLIQIQQFRHLPLPFIPFSYFNFFVMVSTWYLVPELFGRCTIFGHFFLVKYCSKSHYSLHLCSSCLRRHKHIHTHARRIIQYMPLKSLKWAVWLRNSNIKKISIWLTMWNVRDNISTTNHTSHISSKQKEKKRKEK